MIRLRAVRARLTFTAWASVTIALSSSLRPPSRRRRAGTLVLVAMAAALAVISATSAAAEPRCATIADCAKRCEGGDAAACSLVRDALASQCEQKVAAACQILGEVYWEGRFSTVVDVARGVQLNRAACELGDGNGCNQWAFALAYGQGVPRDDARAVLVWKRGCELDDGLSCGTYGARLRVGRGVARDDELAGTILVKACKLRDPTGCSQLGYWHDDQGRAAEARAAWQVACALGGAPACTRLQELGEALAVGAPDAQSEHAAHVRGCDDDQPVACAEMAGDFRAGHGVEASPEKADVIDSRNCDTGFPPSCAILAGLRADQGQLADADRLYSRACDLGDATACRSAGFVRRTLGTGHDKRTPLELFQRGCRANDPASCFAVGAMFERGDGVRVSVAKALAAYTRACDGRMIVACLNGAKIARGAKAARLRHKACTLGGTSSCQPATAP